MTAAAVMAGPATATKAGRGDRRRGDLPVTAAARRRTDRPGRHPARAPRRLRGRGGAAPRRRPRRGGRRRPGGDDRPLGSRPASSAWPPSRPPCARAARSDNSRAHERDAGRAPRRRAARLAARARHRRAASRQGRLHRAAHRSTASRGAEPAADCLALGRELAASAPRVALLAVGDGTARRSASAPGYLDERAAPFDEAVERAVRDGDLPALAALDPALAADLMAAGRPAWQALRRRLLAARAGADAPADGDPLLRRPVRRGLPRRDPHPQRA